MIYKRNFISLVIAATDNGIDLSIMVEPHFSRIHYS